MKSEETILKRLLPNFKRSQDPESARTPAFARTTHTGRDEVTAGGFCIWPLTPKGLDVALFLLVLAMVAFGLIMVYSSSFIFAQERTGNGYTMIKKQILFAVLGVGAMIVASRISYRHWANWAFPILGGAMLLLALVLVPGIGAKVGGAQRWLRFGELNFQPGELAKFAVILFIAKQLETLEEVNRTRSTEPAWKRYGYYFAPLPIFLLLLAQPDFGTTVMISLVIFLLFFLAGISRKYLFGAVGIGGALAAALILGSAYRRARLSAFLDPWSDPGGKGFQIIQSFVGLHNGGAWGVGLGNGKEKLFFLPEAHNDFIFAVIGEELGFVGVIAVASAFLYFVYRGLRVAWWSYERYQDRFGMYLAAGITLALGLQGFVNMAVVLGLVPTKGLTLPFISYGGSALLVDLFAVGVLLSIARGPGPQLPNVRAL